MVDLAGVVDEEGLDDAVDDALMKRLTEPRKVEWRETMARLGRALGLVTLPLGG